MVLSLRKKRGKDVMLLVTAVNMACISGSFWFAHFWGVHTQHSVRAAAATEGNSSLAQSVPGTASVKCLPSPVYCSSIPQERKSRQAAAREAPSRFYSDQLARLCLKSGQPAHFRNTLSTHSCGSMHTKNILPTQPCKGGLELQKGS